ncbi:MAG: prepilin-type N-terminal cleavage/methylation domain-containing protein [Fimbriimonas sp.]
MKKAFTLIELLVVIAIIAILAAILFPVFAQAKSSAKASASLSNDKQILLGQIQYAADYDDHAVIAQTWITGAQPNPNAIPIGSQWVVQWSVLIQPYMKNLDILNDPAGPKWRVRTERNWTEIQSKSNMMGYGYNATAWSPLPLTGDFTMKPVSFTSIDKPAETAMTTGSMMNWVDSSFGVYWSVNGSGVWLSAGIVDSPACWPWTYSLCVDGWGNSDLWQGFIGTTGGQEAGSRSGGVSMRVARQGVIGFGDGHVKRMSLSRAAQGTNWTPDTYPWDIQVLEPEKYLWGKY